MTNKNIFGLLCETTLLVLTLHAMEIEFPIPNRMSITAIPDFPYEPIDCFFFNEVTKLSCCEESFLVINESTFARLRKFLPVYFPQSFSESDRMDFFLPTMIGSKKIARLIELLETEHKGIFEEESMLEHEYHTRESDRYLYERISVILLLSLTLCRGHLKDGTVFFFTTRSFVPDALIFLQEKGFLKWCKSHPQGHYVQFTVKGKQEGIRLVEKHFPKADPKALNLFSKDIIRRLMSPIDMFMTSIEGTIKEVLQNRLKQ